MLFRGDSAFYAGEIISACTRAGVAVSVTVSGYPSVQRAIAAISADAWTPIRYPQAVWDEQASCWVSDAEVAETAFTAFAKSRHVVTGRLIVRRVKDKNTQGALFPVWRHHACFTTSAAPLAQAEKPTAATRSSSTSTTISRPGRWPTSPPGSSPPTAPGSPAPRLPSTSPAPPEPSPRPSTPGPAPPPSAAR
jgi:hypothetical protein